MMLSKDDLCELIDSTITPKLHMNKEKLQLIIDTSPIGICTVGPLGNYITTNLVYEQIVGYTKEELVGLSFYDVTHPNDRPKNKKLFQDMFSLETKGFSMEKRYIRKDGAEIEVIVYAVGVSDSDGKLKFGAAFVDDITERKKARKELIASEARYCSMMEAMIDPAYTCSADFHIEYMNSAMIKKIGRNAVGEICYKSIYNIEEKCSWCAFDEINKGKTKTYEKYDSKTGRYYSINCSPINYSEGPPSKLSIFRDISEIKIAQKERIETEIKFQQTQKMESIGILAGAIAHNFNNILMVILGYMEAFKIDKHIMGLHWEKIGAIEKQIDSAATLTSQLLGFAKGGKYSPKIYNINKIVDLSLNLFIDTRHEIIVHKYFSETVMAVLLDKIQINQVFLNIYINAMQAMPGGGNLYVETSCIYIDDSTIIHGLTPGSYVIISIKDEGCGIKNENMEKIFDPFFTTKGDLGSGMGLASSYGIVKNHKGTIIVNSKKDVGTTFSVYLPIIIQNEKNTS